MNRLFSILIALFIFLSVEASVEREVVNDSTQNPIFQNIQYKLETSGSFSGNKTPLWLNANQYGLSSLEKLNGYVRGAIERPLSVDNAKKWGIGYGLDIAVPVNYTSNIVIQQAYVEGKWWHGTLTIGAKEQPMEL